MSNNLYPNPNPSSLDDLFAGLNQIITQYLDNYVYTIIPCEVVELQTNNAFVNVKPVLQHIDTVGNVLPITNDDIFYNIPMLTLFGNKCEISFLVEAGDKGLLLANKYDISNYKKERKASPIASPRKFSFSDAMFIPLDFQGKQDGVIVRNTTTQTHWLPTSITDTTSDKTVNASNSMTVNTKTDTTNATTSTTNATTITFNGDTITLNGGTVSLGAGSLGRAGVARVGDTVEVYVTGGSSAGTWQGVITGGSSVCTST